MNKTYTVRCTESYEEDNERYYTKGQIYKAKKEYCHGEWSGDWVIETDQGTEGHVGPSYLLEDFDENFEIVSSPEDNPEAGPDPVKDLLTEIDERLSNRYKIIDGNKDSVIVRDRETNTDLIIKAETLPD